MKKGQMSAFMIFGIIILVLIVFIFSAVTIAKKASLKKQTDEVVNSLFEKAELQKYVEACLFQTAKDATKDIFESGGFYWNVTTPGSTININENKTFLEYYDDVTDSFLNVSYLLYRGVDDYAPFYPCPLFGTDCGGPGERMNGREGTNLFCKYSFSNFPYIDTCTYGDFASLYLELVPNSIEKQLESLISSRIATCVNLKSVSEEKGYNVDEIHDGDIKTDVVFSSKSIKYKLDFPVVAELGGVQSVRVSSAKFELPTDIKTLFERSFFGANSVLRHEVSNLNSSLEKFIQKRLGLNNLQYNVVAHHNVYELDDIYSITSKEYSLEGKPFRFLFAVGNRMPVLDLIDLAPDNDSCEVVVPSGVGITIEPKAKDPDEEDTLQFYFDAPGWERSGKKISKIIEQDDDRTTITVTVSDGLLNDSQQVIVCVDNDVEITIKPTIKFYYDYEQIDNQYRGSGTSYQRITLEDPITLSLPSGITMDGYFMLGDCKISMPEGGSNCVVFPGNKQTCDEPYTFSIQNIKKGTFEINGFDDCNLQIGALNDVSFYDVSNTLQGVTKVYVDECVPHKDVFNNVNENEYLETHSCCTSDYHFVGSSGVVSSQTKYFCGKYPDDSFMAPSANDIFQKVIQQRCLPDRGNIVDTTSTPVEEWTNNGNPITVCPDDSAFGVDARCMGCGMYGTFSDDLSCEIYDYDKRDQNKASFESVYYQTSTPAICNEELICTQRAGPGEYQPLKNESSLNVLACKAGCNGNSGRCDYAVDCTCSVLCNGYVDLACNGKEPGVETGMCSQGNPAIKDVCTSACQIGDATNGVFTCKETGDCSSCDVECDGAKPFEEINSCKGGESSLLQDYCDGTGHVSDYINPITHVGKCFYDEDSGCTQGDPECSGVDIGSVLPSLVSEDDPLRSLMCDSNCKLVTSNVCSDSRDVATDCRGKTIGVAFDYDGNLNADAVCLSCTSPIYCNAYAWNNEEQRCYTMDDDAPAEIKCNRFSSSIVDGHVRCE